jgi:hypothetical protein
MKMLEIVAAETETHYQQVREPLAEFIATDGAQSAEMGLDTQAALDFFFNPGEEDLPGVYAPPSGRMFLATSSARSAGLFLRAPSIERKSFQN